MAKPFRQTDIDNELAKTFRPRFQEHEDGGLPMRDIGELLNLSITLPPRKVQRFLSQVDAHPNDRITFRQFRQQMSLIDREQYREVSRAKRVLNRAVLSVAPTIMERKPKSPPPMDDLEEGDVEQALWVEKDDMVNYMELYTLFPPPLFIPFITLLEIAVFIYYAIKLANDGKDNNDVGASCGWDPNSTLIYDPKKRAEVWRFLSYGLLHHGYIHLIFNCVLQLILGCLLELACKSWRVAIVYLLGVLSGSLATSVFDRVAYLMGASGGCYALIGAHIATVIMNWSQMQIDWKDNPVNFVSSGVFRLTVLLLLTFSDTALAVYNRFFDYSDSKNNLKVGFAAHGGGFIAGILIGIPILENVHVLKWERFCLWISIIIYALLTGGAIIYNIVVK